MSPRRRSRNADGVVLPTRLMVLSISVVCLGGLAFFATQGDDNPADVARPSSSSSKPAPAPITEGPGGPTPSDPVVPTTPPAPKPVNRTKVTVVVFNNTNVQGFAGKTATSVESLGWNVFKTDNWRGVVDATTVYYAPKLKDAAKLLAKDLGIKRIKPLLPDMNPKMLNIILTTDYL